MSHLYQYFKYFSAAVFILFLSHCSTNDGELNPKIQSPETALSGYVNQADPAYKWEINNSFVLLGATVYELLLTSQKWREYTWTHQLTVIVPPVVQYTGALLYITGGSNSGNMPKWSSQNDGETIVFSLLASRNKAVVAVLRQTPNQPLFGNLSEDALIAYTLNQFKSDGDYTWPLLFPMVKGAVSAMDAVQEFSQENLDQNIDKFLVSGGSKRGWTTWLTAAVDNRVAAIVPAVIDMLNMPVSLDYHLEVWGDYSPQIQDYVDLGIPQEVHTAIGGDIATMIDPFSYRATLTMPKLILIGTNDPYWPVDAIKHYIDDIPGENYIRYVPNAGHGLNGGEEAALTISAFFGQMLAGMSFHDCAWEVSQNPDGVDLAVTATGTELVEGYLWSASSADRDFRDETWTPVTLDAQGKSLVEVEVDYPSSGFRAFYIDLEYPDRNGGTYTKSTRMFVCDDDEIFLN